MLAFDWKRAKVKPAFPLWGQVKLDGHRCLARKLDGVVGLFSRKLEPIVNFPHINKALEPMLTEDGVWFDGELYKHGMPLQELTALANRTKHLDVDSNLADRSGVMLVIYDMFNVAKMDMQYIQRYRYIKKHVTVTDEIKLISNRLIKSDEDIEAQVKINVGRGYEGLMLRVPGSLYEFNRSKGLMKYKLLNDEYALIEKIIRVPKRKNGIVLKCFLHKIDNSFNINGSGSDEYRAYVWDNRDDFIGKKIKYNYNGTTKSGKPKFARLVLVKGKYVTKDA